ncbi:MAG: HigA family addiction module antitoxin [Sediminibacterium sp.]|jgi:antitoxin HigA-1
MTANTFIKKQSSQSNYAKIATHPGEILKDEIEERQLIKIQVANKLGIQPGHLSELFKGKRNISASLALKLQDLLGITAETWLNLQNRHDLSKLLANRKV